jgi:hypothetical protein
VTETLSLYIPCETFVVTLTADDSEPSALEKAMLLFLAAHGPATLADVLDFLNLGERLAMDLIMQLWQIGYVLVDAARGSVRLEPHWKEFVEQELWRNIPSAHRVSDTVSLMRELVSSQIEVDSASPVTPLSQSAAPILVHARLADTVTRPELAVIAMRNLPRESRRLFLNKNVIAEIPYDDTDADGNRLGWIRMEFEASTDPERGGSLTLRAAPGADPALTRIGPGIARALTGWALENAEHPAVLKLQRMAKREAPRNSAGLRSRIVAVEDRITAGLAAPRDHKEAMRTWISEIGALTAEVETLERAQGKVGLRVGQDGVPALLRLVARFEHQVVLIAPSLDYDGLLALDGTVLRNLGDRPVDASVVVLWGSQRQRQLSAQCAGFLGNAETQSITAGIQRLYYARRGARIGSALAVVDGRHVYYASVSPLEAAAGKGFNFVLEIRTEPPSPIPRHILEIARDQAPEFALAEQIGLTPWEPDTQPLKRLQEAKATAAATDAKTLSALIETGDIGTSDAVTLGARFVDLRNACRLLADRAAGAGSTVDILSGQLLYQHALDIIADTASMTVEPTLWLGFGQDDIQAAGVSLNRPLVDAVDARARQGLATVVLSAGLPRDATGVVSRAGGVDVSAVRVLCGQFPGLVSVVETPGLPGHFVCGQDRMLIAPAGLASPPLAQARRLTSRLVGVAVADSKLCADFRAALAAQWPALTPFLRAAAPRRRATSRPGAGSAALLVDAWRKALAGRRREDLLAAMVLPGGKRATRIDRAAQLLLDLTAGRAADEADFRALRVDTLAVAAANGSPDRCANALGELAVLAWRERHWHEVSLILSAAALPACPIPAELAAAAAAADVGLPAPDYSAFLAHDDRDRWLAGVALAAKAVLFNADSGLADVLEIKLLDPPPPGTEPLFDIAVAVQIHWSATMSAVTPAVARAIVSGDNAESRLRAAAAEFATKFRQAVDRTYDNTMLKRVVPRMYSDVSGLKPVAAMIGADGAGSWPAVLGGLRAALGEGRVDVTELVDTLFEGARRRFGTPVDPPIAKGHGLGRSIHARAHDVINLAVGLRDAIGGVLTAQDQAASVPLRTLMAAVRTRLPGLSAIGETLPPDSIAAPLLTDLCTRLSQLLGSPP